MSYQLLRIILLLTIILLAHIGLGAPNNARESESKSVKLDVHINGQGDYSCSSGEFARYVGGMYGITVKILPKDRVSGDIEYRGITDWTWPEGLIIEAGRSLSPSDSFVPSALLLHHLNVQYYIQRVQIVNDSLWRSAGKIPPRSMICPEYHFNFQVPPELVDSYLCISVNWDHSQYGYLVAETPVCTKIVRPCSDAVERMVWTTQIWTAEETRKYNLAVLLADSFVTMGWHDLHGLIWATLSAQRLGRYDDAICFLDFCFEVNHTVDIIPERALPEAPSEEDSASYQRQRARLTDLRDQQQRK